MEWRRLTSEREKKRDRKREWEAGRKGRRIVYSNEGVNKWWAARRIDLGRARHSFDTALHPRVAIPAPPPTPHPPTPRRCRPALFPPAPPFFLVLRALLFSLSLARSLSLQRSQPVSLFSVSLLGTTRFNNLIPRRERAMQARSRRFADHRKSRDGN